MPKIFQNMGGLTYWGVIIRITMVSFLILVARTLTLKMNEGMFVETLLIHLLLNGLVFLIYVNPAFLSNGFQKLINKNSVFVCKETRMKPVSSQLDVSISFVTSDMFNLPV